MRTAPDMPRRPGFTLIEMVVVIGIILVLITITALFLPGLQGNQKVQTGVDRLSQWLLTAKQRAKHDGVPTGLVFLGGVASNQCVYVQQPDIIVGDPTLDPASPALPRPKSYCYTPAQANTAGSSPPYLFPLSNTVYFSLGVDFIGSDPANPLVQVGDYLELFGGGSPHLIKQVTPAAGTTPTYLTLYDTVSIPAAPGVSVPGAPNPPPWGTSSYRIIRQPRRVVGEDILTLPQDVVVNFGKLNPPSPTNPNAIYSVNVPSLTLAGIGTNPIILFSPTGSVLPLPGQSAVSGKIMLWVQDATVTNPSFGNPVQGNPTLVTVQVSSGGLGSYPVLNVNSATTYPDDMYQAALQGRSGF
jgi:prepilin-type N-terminal cleavage/methylation domain-containing protein